MNYRLRPSEVLTMVGALVAGLIFCYGLYGVLRALVQWLT